MSFFIYNAEIIHPAIWSTFNKTSTLISMCAVLLRKSPKVFLGPPFLLNSLSVAFTYTNISNPILFTHFWRVQWWNSLITWILYGLFLKRWSYPLQWHHYRIFFTPLKTNNLKKCVQILHRDSQVWECIKRFVERICSCSFNCLQICWWGHWRGEHTTFVRGELVFTQNLALVIVDRSCRSIWIHILWLYTRKNSYPACFARATSLLQK